MNNNFTYSESLRFERLSDIFGYNFRITELYAAYLERFPTLITPELIDMLCADSALTAKDAIPALLSEAFGLDIDDAGKILGAGAPNQLSGILQEVADTKGGDQNCQAGSTTQGLVSQTLNDNTQNRTDHNCRNNGNNGRQAQIIGNTERNVSTHHDNITVSEVQHFGDTIDHGVTQGDDCINCANADAVDQILQNLHN